MADDQGTMSVKKQGDIYTFPGKDVDVSWDERLCIHIGECTRAHGEIFKSGREPWGEPDRAPADEVAAVARRCPTGALTYRRKDGGAAEAPDARNTIMVAGNGPLYVSGDLDIDGAADDMPGVRYRAALCRCGQSKRKPFCDNRHEEAGFIDRGAVGETGESGAGVGEDADGPLQIRRAPNGPLLVTGRVAIRAGSGRIAWRGTKAALCRCGASQNKPFCDGAHAKAGFEAE
jgi:CDGSH-type Zn-finger protein/uncharacterized Fe-S cluster protein YjdI